MNILVTICARKGSKRLKNKNLRLIDGKPLIAYTIEQALLWGRGNNVIVSTDSEEIASISREYGAEVPFIRPNKLASDTAPKLPVIKHAFHLMEKLNDVKYDLIVDLDPTSPLRLVEDIENAYQLMINKKCKNLFSVTAARKNPYFNMVELDENGFVHISKELENPVNRMQDTPKVYELNASIYMYWTKFLDDMENVITDQSIVYEMPQERSLDIDSKFDLRIVKSLLIDDTKYKNSN